MDRALANYTVNALQALVETSNILAANLPAAEPEKVEKLLARVQQARTGIMAEMM